MIIPRKRWQTFALMLGCIVFTAACVAMVILNVTDSLVLNWIVKIVGVVGGLFFAMATVYTLVMLIRNENQIETLEDGFIDNSSMVSLGFIAYQDVQSIYLQGMFVVVRIKNPQEYLSKARGIKKLLIKINKKIGFGIITINAQIFKTTQNLQQFADIIQNRIQK